LFGFKSIKEVNIRTPVILLMRDKDTRKKENCQLSLIKQEPTEALTFPRVKAQWIPQDRVASVLRDSRPVSNHLKNVGYLFFILLLCLYVDGGGVGCKWMSLKLVYGGGRLVHTTFVL